VHFESVQLILALSALEDYYCVSVDVCNAYLYDKLDEEIYMRQPEGFKVRGQENKVICLQRLWPQTSWIGLVERVELFHE
jgi:Reverse transcriptase (RNA-dependent DNA polymerase)